MVGSETLFVIAGSSLGGIRKPHVGHCRPFGRTTASSLARHATNDACAPLRSTANAVRSSHPARVCGRNQLYCQRPIPTRRRHCSRRCCQRRSSSTRPPLCRHFLHLLAESASQARPALVCAIPHPSTCDVLQRRPSPWHTDRSLSSSSSDDLASSPTPLFARRAVAAAATPPLRSMLLPR